MSTAKQISFYNSLLDQIVKLDTSGRFTVEAVVVAREAFPNRPVDEASDAIARAKRTLDGLKAATPAKVEVAEGHYAIEVEGVVKFYEVVRPTEGKWAGYTFVNAQASDDHFKVGRDASEVVLAAIAADPEAAMKRYGIELGKCGHCGRTLTSDWRKVGIGPVCAKKMSW